MWISTSWRSQGGSRSDVLSVPLLAFLRADHDVDVARALLNWSGAPLSGRHEALDLRAFVHDCVLHVQRIDVERLVVLTRRVLRVRDCRVESLLDLHCSVLLGEPEKPKRFVDVLSADLVDH